jgi:hypothetical protein
VCAAGCTRGIDFNCFANPGRDNPITNLGIHPGELHPWLAGVEQAIVRVDMDVVTGAGNMSVGDVAQHRQQLIHERRCIGILNAFVAKEKNTAGLVSLSNTRVFGLESGTFRPVSGAVL